MARKKNGFVDVPLTRNKGWDERMPRGLKKQIKNRKNYGRPA